MSTWIYLVCTDHTPPIRAESESGQHLTDLPMIRAAFRERERITALGAEDFLEITDIQPKTRRVVQTVNTWRFLREHPKCNVEIRDAYDRVHPIEAP